MPSAVHRALALAVVAALGAGVGAGATAQAKERAKDRKHPRTRSHAAKVGSGRGWVPPSLLRSRVPLTGTATAGATAGGPPTPPTDTTPPGPGEAAVPPPTPTPPPPSVASVGVLLKDTPDYLAQLSRPKVASGTVNIQLQNRGEDPHNLRVVPLDGPGPTVDFPLTDPQETVTRTLTLSPGRYYLFCTLTVPVNHADAGMRATLTVE
jgi:plastocyanin